MKKFLIVFTMVVTFTALTGIYAHSETTTPAPKYKFGDQVKVTLPFYSNCGLGAVTELDPITIQPVKTHSYQVEDIDCPIYNRDTHQTEFRRIMLIVNEEDLASKWHTMEGK